MREADIMYSLQAHPHVVSILDSFKTEEIPDQQTETECVETPEDSSEAAPNSDSNPTLRSDLFVLNLVLEYMPQDLYRTIRHYRKINKRIPVIYVKV